jgi:putative heme-binding domain-containing protein
MGNRLWLMCAWPLLLAPAICSAQGGPNPLAGDRQSINDGRKLFTVSCSPCHGRNGEGAQGQAEGIAPPDLTRGVFRNGNRDEDLFRVVSKGVAGSGMPSFEQLGTDNIWRLIAFIRTLAPSEKISGNAANGETIFWGKGDCGRCHAVGSRGVSLGPDLSRGGRRSSGERLKRAIVAPNEEITPGYEVVTVVTKDHKTVTGLQRFFDNFSARVIDSDGNERTYLRDEVISMKREMRSLMPDNYGKTFSDSELNDLVAYIVTLRRSAVQ